MWTGFACASLLSEYPYSGSTAVRFRQRIVGTLAGSFAFFLLYLVTPEPVHPLMGPLGGLCLGFCTDYRYKTAMNCFGALMLATGIYGLQGAILLRMADTSGGNLWPAVRGGFPPTGGSPTAAHRKRGVSSCSPLFFTETIVWSIEHSHKAVGPVTPPHPVRIQTPLLLVQTSLGGFQSLLGLLMLCIASAAPDAHIVPLCVLIPAPNHMHIAGRINRAAHLFFRDLIGTGIIPKARNLG